MYNNTVQDRWSKSSYTITEDNTGWTISATIDKWGERRFTSDTIEGLKDRMKKEIGCTLVPIKKRIYKDIMFKLNRI